MFTMLYNAHIQEHGLIALELFYLKLLTNLNGRENCTYNVAYLIGTMRTYGSLTNCKQSNVHKV